MIWTKIAHIPANIAKLQTRICLRPSTSIQSKLCSRHLCPCTRAGGRTTTFTQIRFKPNSIKVDSESMVQVAELALHSAVLVFTTGVLSWKDDNNRASLWPMFLASGDSIHQKELLDF